MAKLSNKKLEMHKIKFGKINFWSKSFFSRFHLKYALLKYEIDGKTMERERDGKNECECTAIPCSRHRFDK